MVVGVQPSVEPTVSELASPDHRIEGAYLRTRDELPYPSDPADIYIGEKLARTLDVELDDRVVLTVAPAGASRPSAAAFRVRGVFHTGVDELDGFYAQIPLAEAQSMLSLGHRVTQVALLLDDLRATARVQQQMAAAVEDAGLAGLEVLPWQVALRELYEAIVLDDIGNYLMHAIVFLIVAIGIFNTILMSVMERTREFGVMLAIGTSGRRLFEVVMLEAVVLAVVACAAGLAIGLSMHLYVAHVGVDVGALYGEDFNFAGIAFSGTIYSTLYAPQVASWAVIVFFIVLLSSVYPAVRATRLKPVEAMHHA
jgi:ABC-type lipoprotein release transport system permease subunit